LEEVRTRGQLLTNSRKSALAVTPFLALALASRSGGQSDALKGSFWFKVEAPVMRGSGARGLTRSAVASQRARAERGGCCPLASARACLDWWRAVRHFRGFLVQRSPQRAAPGKKAELERGPGCARSRSRSRRWPSTVLAIRGAVFGLMSLTRCAALKIAACLPSFRQVPRQDHVICLQIILTFFCVRPAVIVNMLC